MSKRRPLKIAITGPPAAGKSTVLRIFSEMGIPTFSADEVVHELSRPCQKGYHEVIKKLGQRFLQEDGQLDRRALLEAMLEDAQIKKTLEEIFHPLVKERLLSWFDEHQDASFLAAEIPLLYQAGWENLFDQVIFVTCDEKTLKERLMRRIRDPKIVSLLLKGYRALPREKDIVLSKGFTPKLVQKLLSQLET